VPEIVRLLVLFAVW